MAQNEYSNEPKWYIIHTYTGYENKIKKDLEQKIENRNLEDYIFKIVVPMEEQIQIKNNKKESRLKKVFPGYVLIKMIVTEKTWYIVRNTKGVTGFVGAGTNPIPLTNDEIIKMGLEDVTSDGKTEFKVDYEIGDNVEILSGSLKGYTGKVEEIKQDSQKVKIIVDMFGSETTVELEFLQVQKKNK